MPHSGFCILVHHSISKALKKVLRWALGATRSGSLERPLRILCDSPPLLRSTMEQFIFVEILFSNRSNFTGERPMNKFQGLKFSAAFIRNECVYSMVYHRMASASHKRSFKPNHKHEIWCENEVLAHSLTCSVINNKTHE